MRDGLHLSGKGAAVFAEGLSGAVASGLGRVRYLNKWGRGICQRRQKKVQEYSRCRGIQGSTPKEEIKCVCLNARIIINKKNELNIMVDVINPQILGIT